MNKELKPILESLLWSVLLLIESTLTILYIIGCFYYKIPPSFFYIAVLFIIGELLSIKMKAYNEKSK